MYKCTKYSKSNGSQLLASNRTAPFSSFGENELGLNLYQI